jgi:hypothetical protein
MPSRGTAADARAAVLRRVVWLDPPGEVRHTFEHSWRFTDDEAWTLSPNGPGGGPY